MKKDIFLSTKKKIIATSTIIVFGCLIVFAIITQVLYSSRVLDVIDHQLLEQKEILTKEQFNPNYYEYIFNEDRHNLDGDLHKDEFKNPDGGENPHRPENFDGKLDSKPKRIPPNLIVIVYKNNEFETMSRNLYFSKDNLPTISNDAENEVVTIINNGYNFREIAISSGEYKIQVIANIDSEVNSINRLRYSIAVSLIILIIIAIILSAYLSTKVIRPVREAYEKQVYFVQDASHEMRTPLAVIKGKLELLAHSWGDTIDDHFEHISKMMSEVRGLEKLNSDLLLLSKEDLDLSINITKFKLNDLINDISEFYFDLAEIKEKIFKVVKPEEEILVQWDYDKIKRAIIILIENAFKYTGEDGEINLVIEDVNKHIRIMVVDNGIGIKKDEEKRIFDRFYRSDIVRGQNINGTGIGLSLLKSISKNFVIKLKVNSEYGIGSEFILLIPKIIK
ncbi:sensor histidine kinase [Clostridium beijerinckii]|uniref:sensor histidine kinase n=1 Tax=Clostridium beijerinckii TaxID=1520 RepID=UPI0014941A2B|nr:HAMP domain-containing sensor histidine kinase [Clostridium beijerinckii]NOW88690.1 signal transduction histidine kinase [Clostridium beijerinckii]